MGGKAERIRKGEKNLSGDGEEEGGGESRVQNLPKAFGESKIFRVDIFCRIYYPNEKSFALLSVFIHTI